MKMRILQLIGMAINIEDQEDATNIERAIDDTNIKWIRLKDGTLVQKRHIIAFKSYK